MVADTSFTKSCPTLATPWTVACQVPLSMGFSRQQHWSGLLFPSPGDPPGPRIKPGSPALQTGSLPTELWGKPSFHLKDAGLSLTINTVSYHPWRHRHTLLFSNKCLPSLNNQGISQLFFKVKVGFYEESR